MPVKAPAKIQCLSPHVAAQIAAGEVIQRPADAANEMIQNALDAGAKNIIIKIEQAGANLIEIQDDGCGIPKTELKLALSCHATSKINAIEDLNELSSFGFRGEALASIVSIAKVTLASKADNQEEAWKIQCDGQPLETATITACAHKKGSTITVRDLFFNTPVRRKFLKSERSEYQHIVETVRKLSLSHFDVHFQLIHNGRNHLDLPSCDPHITAQEKRLKLLFPSGFTDQLLNITDHNALFNIQGWLCHPTTSRATGDLQYWLINGRCIKDKGLSYAVRRAYYDMMPPGRHPAFILYLTIDTHCVDVNVHPSKEAVRFSNAQTLYQAIYQSIRKRLAQGKIPSQTPQQLSQPTQPEPYSHTPDMQTQMQSLHTKPAQHSLNKMAETPFLTPNNTTDSRDIQFKTQTHYLKEAVNQTSLDTPKIQMPKLGIALAQLHGIYILAQNAQGLIIIDMHAAHERIDYEKLKANYQSTGIPCQALIKPVAMHNLTTAQLECLNDKKIVLSQLGLKFNQHNALTHSPAHLKDHDLQNTVLKVINELIEYQTHDHMEKTLHEILSHMACRGAIKANRQLTLAEMNALIEQMEATQCIDQCNHGRPTWQQITIQSLDQYFKRGQ